MTDQLQPVRCRVWLALPNMNKPSDIKIWLYESWPIHTLKVHYDMTSVDTAETNVTIEGANGKKKLRWDTVKPLLTVQVSYNSVAELNYPTKQEVEKWKAFEKEHAADLAELARLQAKLSGANSDSTTIVKY